MNKATFLKLVALFVVLMTSSHGQSETIEHESVIVEFDEPLHKTAQEVLEIYPALKTELEAAFNWRLNFKPKVILTTARKDSRRLSDSPLVVAYALPHNTLIVIDYSKMRTDPFMFRATFGLLIPTGEGYPLLFHRGKGRNSSRPTGSFPYVLFN